MLNLENVQQPAISIVRHRPIISSLNIKYCVLLHGRMQTNKGQAGTDVGSGKEGGRGGGRGRRRFRTGNSLPQTRE